MLARGRNIDKKEKKILEVQKKDGTFFFLFVISGTGFNRRDTDKWDEDGDRTHRGFMRRFTFN
jgi:hypothetical protein